MKKNFKKQVVAVAMATTMAFSMVPMNTWQYRSLAAAQAQAEDSLYSSDKTLSKEFDFTGYTDDNCWDEGKKLMETYATDIADVSLPENVIASGKVTIDKTAYDSLDKEGSYLKLQSVVKIGTGWDWTQANSFPYLDKNAFTEQEDGTYTATFEDKFSDIAGGDLHEIIFQIVGVDAKGTISISDVSLASVANTATTTEQLVYSGTADLSKDLDFTGYTDDNCWDADKKLMETYATDIADVVLTENVVAKGKVTIDQAMYDSLDKEGSYLKLQSVVKIGDGWDWTQANSFPYLDKNAFTKQEDGTYAATFEDKFSDIAGGDLHEIIFQIVGVDAKGHISISDVSLTNVISTATTVEKLVYSGTADLSKDLDFTGYTDDNCWDADKKLMETYATDIADVVLTENVVAKGKVTIDQTMYDSLDKEGSYLKLQSVVKIGDGWDWTQANSFPYLDKNAFTEQEDGIYTATFEDKFSDIAGGDLHEIIFQIVGVDAKGTITLSDITLSNLITTTGEVVLPEKEPTVIDDFEDVTDTSGWEEEAGYKYESPIALNVASLGDGKALKLGLDYTGCEDISWSEAKIKKVISDGIDVSAYNLLTYDIIYPEEFEGVNGFKTKVFAKNSTSNKTIIDKEGTKESTVFDAEKGLKKATVTVKFSPNTESITDLIIGTIGVNSSFKGDVYIDNVTFGQLDPSADYVDITAKIGDATVANTEGMVSEVSLANPNANTATKALYSYLKNLDAKDQVLFGHQNDTYKKVSTRDGVDSDTKDVTGSISAIVGMDTMDLTGSQIDEADAATAIETCVKHAKDAAADGAIITLSTHMPNMSSDTIKVNKDGTFDFTACNFAESKDLSNNCAEEVMPGGKYNAQFTAYLDIIAEYANELGDIPVLFRPFHENDGGWFWWGSATTDKQSYIAMYRYMVDYLTNEKGVNNFIYVYSPNGPVMDEDKYLDRYPGDAYVDILAFDYYDDYNSYPAEYSDAFFKNIKTSCETIKKIADEKGKVAAISETGVRVMKADGSDNEGLLVKNNPIKDQDWYNKLNDVAVETGMPYFLLWSNFMDTNFYVPYKYNDTKGQELINEFIDFYNDDASIFADGTNFYAEAAKTEVTNKANTAANGYFLNTFSKETILEAKTVKAVVKNAEKVQIVLKNKDADVTKKITATEEDGVYSAEITDAILKELGKTDVGTVSIVADDEELVTLKNISFGKEKEKLPKDTLDNFELYYGDNDGLSGAYSENSAAGCSSTFTLDAENKASGSFGGSFDYTLKTSGPEVWTGRMKGLDENDYSEYNALTMWVKPDGKGQKLVIQLVSNGEDFEAFLTDFTATTEAKKITIPFSALKGKNGGTFDASNVTKFAVWCNSNPIGEEVDITSSIKFDNIKFAKVNEADYNLPEGEGKYAVSDAKEAQTITASNITKTAGDEAFALNAKVTGDGALSYVSSDEKVAKVDDKGMVTIVGGGTATITISAAETENYKAATKEITITVNKKEQKITASDVVKTVGDAAFALDAKTDGDGALTYTSSDEKVAKVDEKGNVTIVGGGSTTITVKAAETANCKAAEKKVNISVHAKAQSITAEDVTATTKTADFNLNAKTSGDGALSYVSDNESVATVDANGVVSIKGVGEANITITAAQTANSAADIKTVKVTVKPAKMSLLSVKSKKKKTAYIKWSKDTKVNGYVLQYSTSKKFTKKTTKTVTISKTSVNAKTIKKLKAGKKYYVRMRAFANVNGKKVNGAFSKVKTVKVKKK